MVDIAWFATNNIAEKLRAAIEEIVVGQGWQVFEGLETGEVIVKITHDGQKIQFLREIPRAKEQKLPTSEEPIFGKITFPGISEPIPEPQKLEEKEEEPL